MGDNCDNGEGGMASLAPEQIRHLIRLMDERYAREVREIEAVEARMRSERKPAMQPVDLKDIASADLMQANDDAIVGQDLRDLRDILAARERLASGTYGKCIECGNGIHYQRLLAYPTAKRCMACQLQREGGRPAATSPHG